MKKVSIVLVLIWMIVIFTFSNKPAQVSTQESDNIVNIVYRIFKIDTKYNDLIIKAVRKSAHFIEYMILGILVLNMLHYYNIKDIILLSILICMLYACSDEIHQLFIMGRSGELIDSLLDTSGSMLGIYLYNIFINKKLIN